MSYCRQSLEGGRTMPNVWLVLGQERLLEADEGALPALSSLCEALGVSTHWDEADRTLYLSPLCVGALSENEVAKAESFQEVAEITDSPEELGIQVEYVQPLTDNSEDVPRVVLFADYSVVQDLMPPTAPEPTVQPIPARAPKVVAEIDLAPPVMYIPEPQPEPAVVEAEPVLVSEPLIVLPAPAAAPPPRPKPFADPRTVPGASRVIVFQREREHPKAEAPPPAPAPVLEPPPAPTVAPTPEPVPEPAPVLPQAPLPAAARQDLISVATARPQKPYVKEVRVIQQGSTVMRTR